MYITCMYNVNVVRNFVEDKSLDRNIFRNIWNVNKKIITPSSSHAIFLGYHYSRRLLPLISAVVALWLD